MNKHIEDLQIACEELELRTRQLDAWMPDGASTHAKRLMTVVTRLSNEVNCKAELLTNYAQENRGCRCIELAEILELIPKNLSLGEFLELKDLIHQHFKGG